MENNSNSSAQGTTSAQSTTSGQSNTENQGGLNMGSITDMLGGLNIPDTLKKYSGTATRAISSMSTTQKVIGGALLLLGATYLTRGSRAGWMKKAGALGGLAKMAKGKNKSGH